MLLSLLQKSKTLLGVADSSTTSNNVEVNIEQCIEATTEGIIQLNEEEEKQFRLKRNEELKDTIYGK